MKKKAFTQSHLRLILLSFPNVQKVTSQKIIEERTKMIDQSVLSSPLLLVISTIEDTQKFPMIPNRIPRKKRVTSCFTSGFEVSVVLLVVSSIFQYL